MRRGGGHAFAGLGQLADDLLETEHLAFVHDLLLFGVLDEFEDFLHVLEGLLEGIDDAFDLEDGLLDAAG